jgi:hypothetical protein
MKLLHTPVIPLLLLFFMGPLPASAAEFKVSFDSSLQGDEYQRLRATIREVVDEYSENIELAADVTIEIDSINDATKDWAVTAKDIGFFGYWKSMRARHFLREAI